MTQQPTYSPHNPHPLSLLRTVLEGQQIYDQSIYDRLQITPQQLMEFCQKWQIAELAVFGSILRDDFRVGGDDPSDVDVLMTYGKNSRKNLILQVRMKFELETLFHRNVDLVSKTAIIADPNYIRRQNILGSARTIYVER
jgi:predicted nucleotidyltransferase